MTNVLHTKNPNVITTWKKRLEQFSLYIEIDVNTKYERSLVDERDLSHMV